MDERQINYLTRSVAYAVDRRTGVRGLLALGGVLGGVLGIAGDAMANKNGKCKPACPECQQCKRGKCHKTNSGKKQCKKGKCKAKDDGTTCSTGKCQAGVCESTPPSCIAPTPTATSPTRGLQEAINQAEAGATLTLCAGTWNLTETVSIVKDITLIGAGAGATVLNGGDAVQVLQIDAGDFETNPTVTLQDLTLTKGKTTYGGGIYTRYSTLTLIGVSVTGNATEGYGGGIYTQVSLLTLESGSQITDNTAGNRGGGIYIDQGMVKLEAGSSVMGNTATERGGGIYDFFCELTLQAGSSVTGNTSAEGGGIYRDGGGSVLLEGADPSPIVVDNCQDNCAGTTVDKCAPPPVSC